MSDSHESDSASISDEFAEGAGPRLDRGDELPPVRPPSAGFIIQLFVIPALIVAVIVGVWAVFGRMAAGEQDWRELVDEIKNTNEHRRWRGANGLATLLDSDQRLGDRGQNLAENREIATALSELFREGLHKRSQREDDLKQQAFLARTLGLSDVTTTTFPVLQEGMQPDQDREVRKNSLAAVAVAAGRAAEKNRTVSEPKLVAGLVEATRDEDALIRQLGTFTLGLVPSEASTERLTVLLGDSDPNTRVNAAVSLARQSSKAGIDVFRDIFRDAAAESADAINDPARLEKLLAIKNGLKAIRDLSDTLSTDERVEFTQLIEPIASSHSELRLRTDATDVLLVLKGQSGESSPR